MYSQNNSSNTYVKEGWSTWTKRSSLVFPGQHGIAGDPCVFKDGDIYRMYYTGFDLKKDGCIICQATSKDGYTWDLLENGCITKGKMLDYRPGKWDDTHETPFAVKVENEYLLYFCGYKDNGGAVNSFPAHLGLAFSAVPYDFTNRYDQPVMYCTPDGYDQNAIFSPSIVHYSGIFYMIYTGWGNNSLGKLCTYICGATSVDGRNWIKVEKPVLHPDDLPWIKDGAGEPELILGPDNYWYLFFTILNGDVPHDLGIARSSNPFGPWEINPDPILKPTPGTFDAGAIVAPAVIIEGNKVRMWYSGFNAENTLIQTGYAESSWPLKME